MRDHQAQALMTDTAITTPTRQAIEAKDRSAPLKVTGKLKAAIDAMVWQGLARAAAAEKAGIAEHSLYVAFRKPHVKAHYLGELEVLRTSERARNIHRLTDIRDKADNMPAVQAIKMLEDMSGESATRSTGSLTLPGLTIQIIQQVGGAAIEAAPVDVTDKALK